MLTDLERKRIEDIGELDWINVGNKWLRSGMGWLYKSAFIRGAEALAEIRAQHAIVTIPEVCSLDVGAFTKQPTVLVRKRDDSEVWDKEPPNWSDKKDVCK